MTALLDLTTTAPRRVLGVWAHPDDEAYLSAGLMLRTIAAGGQAACLHATAGEQGTDDPRGCPPDRLARRRTDELREALGELGVADVAILGYPDGGCEDVEDQEAVESVVRAIVRTQPEVIVTFGPDGITGHPDHIAVGRWTTNAWARTGRGRLLYAATPDSFRARHRQVHERLGLFDDDSLRTPDHAISHQVRLTDAELTCKRRALAAHASQTIGLAAAMGEDTYRSWYDVESFRDPTRVEIAACAARVGVA